MTGMKQILIEISSRAFDVRAIPATWPYALQVWIPAPANLLDRGDVENSVKICLAHNTRHRRKRLPVVQVFT